MHRVKSLYIVLAVGALVLGWGVYTYNRFVSLRRHIDEAWSGVRVQLKRRHDLIPNLVEAVKGYAGHEKSLFTEIAGLRSAATSALSAPAKAMSPLGAAVGISDSDSLPRALEAERALGPALGRLVAVAEAYPELKASKHFTRLQENLSALEDDLQMARRYYNGTVRDYTILRESFPSLFIAKIFKFEPRLFFELDDPTEAAAPRVKL